MKAIKFVSCIDCLTIFKGKPPSSRCPVKGKPHDSIHPSCPLPDWPSVNKKQVSAISETLLQDGARRERSGAGQEDILGDWLRSVGVEIKEDKP